MSILDRDRWKLLSPHLDLALRLPDEERSRWLTALRDESPTLAADLESLIAQQRRIAEERFLEEQVPFPSERCYPGLSIGLYTLVSEIGAGGMGTVWLAERSDGRFDRRVAIKFLNITVSGVGAEQRFKREGSILARLSHPNIAELIDAGVASNGQSYLVLEYIEGKHIDRYCDEHRLSIPQRVRLFRSVLAAVLHAHGCLIVHRDLKPSNVLVSNDGRVKLLDFGIAKLLSKESAGEDTTLLTLGGIRPMTPGYAAPEQLQGGSITTSTDVYALGVLLYELLTGTHPAGSGPQTPAELIKAVVDQDPLRPSVAVNPVGSISQVGDRARLRGSTPDRLQRILRDDLDTIILKALKKDPRERYHSVAAFAEDLQRYLRNEPIRARPDSISYRTRKFVRRHRVPVLLAAVALLAIAVGGVATVLQARVARQQRDFAIRQLERTERITGLNELLLSEVAPMGKPITKDDLLQREEQIVEREHNDDLASHVEMLISIGQQYSAEEENVHARRVLESAYQLSRNVPDPATRAKAACEFGWALLPVGESERAETLFQTALHELPENAQYDPVRVQCLLDGGEIAYRNGDSHEQLRRTQLAERVFNNSPVRSPVAELNVLVGLADGYAAIGRFAESDAAFRRASARMASLGYDKTQKAVKLLNDWGLMLTDAGRPLPAADAFRQAIEINRTNQTEEEVLPAILHNYSAVLRELGKLTEAADYAERAHQKAVQANNHILATQSDLQRARIYRDQHDYQRSHDILSNLEPILRTSLPPGHYAFAILSSENSLLAEAQGDLPSALRLANEAITIDETASKLGGQGAIYLPAFLVRRSNIELEMNNVTSAEADAARAVRLLKDKTEAGAQSSTLGRAYMALARAMAANGKSTEARTMAYAALQNLQSALGSDHPETIKAAKLLS